MVRRERRRHSVRLLRINWRHRLIDSILHNLVGCLLVIYRADFHHDRVFFDGATYGIPCRPQRSNFLLRRVM